MILPNTILPASIPSMPIEVFAEIHPFSQEEFHSIDHQVMGIIFDVHNEYGRLVDEAVFKSVIALLCEQAGITPAEREVRIRVRHESFAKDYSMDLLIAHGLPVEAKTAEMLSPVHRSQVLNYLFLAGLHHARLVNLRTERVQHEFVSTRLTHELRREFTFVAAGWREVNPESSWLKAKLNDLLHDWGAFLEVSLYRDAITHFLGGVERVRHKIEILSGDQAVGVQATHLLTDDTAFALSSVTERHEHMREHLLRFLRHTRLRHLQWVNFNQAKIQFITLSRET